MPLMGSLVHWTQLRRESELEPAINRILKPESKRIKTGKKKKKNRISKDMGHLQGYDIHIMGISEGERNRRHI